MKQIYLLLYLSFIKHSVLKKIKCSVYSVLPSSVELYYYYYNLRHFNSFQDVTLNICAIDRERLLNVGIF